MAVIVVCFSIAITVVIVGAIVFQILPRIFPKLRTLLPSQAVVSYIQLVPVSFIFPTLLWLFFSVYLNAHVPNQPYSSLQGWFHIFITNYMMANAVFNYYMTVFTCPGYPQHQDEFTRDRLFVKTYQMCVKCNRIRSAGTHHCSWCHTCVEMMCHHCPFTNNCIGRRNYVYYYTFLCYAFFGLLYACYLTYFPFKNCISVVAAERFREIVRTLPQISVLQVSGVSGFKGLTDVSVPEGCDLLKDYSILFAPAVGITFFIGFLFGFQTLLLLADMSIVDFYDMLSNVSSLQELLRILHVSIFKRKKFRFNNLILKKKSQSWMFFVPYPNDVGDDLPLKDL